MFFFYSDSAYHGKGGYFTVTGVDAAGRITEIDGTLVRTGPLHNGFPSSTFDEVMVPILNGGRWKVIPKIRYVPNPNGIKGQPYNNTTNGFGIQVTPYSNDLGQINSILFRDVPYFNDSDDISINVPFNFLVENNDTIEKGNIISLQTYQAFGNDFIDDSEVINYQIVSRRDVGENWLRFREVDFNLPLDFDSEFFQWTIKQYAVHGSSGIRDIVTDLDSDSILAHTSTFEEDLVYDGGEGYAAVDSDAVTDLDGGSSFASVSPIKDLGGYDNIPSQYWTISFNNNKFVDKLDSYHFQTLDAYNPVYADSDMYLKLNRLTGNPNLPTSLDVGNWVDRGLYGRVISVDTNVIKVIPEPGYRNITDSDMLSISMDKYGLIRMSPLSIDGRTETNKDLKITNAVLSWASFEFDYKVSSVLSTNKQFINEDGFLNSESGGILNDNYFYSTHSYVVKSTLPIKQWRGKVKTLLHPAGKIMFGETIVEQPIDATTQFTSDTQAGKIPGATFTYSMAQDYWVDGLDQDQITADQTLYKSNAFERITSLDINGVGLRADNFTNLNKIADKTQNGNAFWDYEPIGWIRKELMPVSTSGLINVKDYESSWSSQDSDGNGYVKNEIVRYSRWNNSIQDFYKNDSRFEAIYSAPLVKRNVFADVVSEKYKVYDSDLPTDLFMRIGDSDAVFMAIDYNRMRTEGDTTTNWPTFIVDRQQEIAKKRFIDFNNAMKEDGTLSYKVANVTYENFDAYDYKWNVYNDNRTDGRAGWVIPGWHSFIQNTSQNLSRKRRQADFILKDIEYTTKRTPLLPDIWDQPGADYWTWNHTYNREINNTEYFDYDLIKKDEDMTFDYDPDKWMNHRRVK